MSEETYSFNLTFGAEVETIAGHQEAVARAKALSEEAQGRVLVERTDGIVTMNFSHGQLDSYVYETRERRREPRNDRRRDRDEEKASESDESDDDDMGDESDGDATDAATTDAAE